MAQVRSQVHQDVDRLLEQSLAAWQSLPEVEAEIDQWDLIEQLDYVEEWPIEEDRLAELEHYAAHGVLTPDQLARHEELKRIVQENRPIIRRLSR